MTEPGTAYVDASGQPCLRESISAFIDVLGFSQNVVTAAEGGHSPEFLKRISRALDLSRAAVRDSMAQHSLYGLHGWAIKFFSDNLLLGYPLDPQQSRSEAAAFIVRCTQHYELQMALQGFFVRGAMTIGPLCVTDDIIFGTSLIESYQLESKTSIVPRVILTPAIMELITAASRNSPPAEDLVCRDIDGWWFVNYLGVAVQPDGVDWALIERHRESVLATKTQAPRHDILPKFGWVSRYHNLFCHWHRHLPGYSESLRIKRIDEESVITRLSETLHGSP